MMPRIKTQVMLLKKERFREAFREAAGIWSDGDHPDLTTYKDMDNYLQTIRVVNVGIR